MIVQKYFLDVVHGNVPVIVPLSQYDSDFSLVFSLYASTGEFTIEEGTTATIRGTKGDGNGYSVDATIDIASAEVTVEGDEQLTVIAGKQLFELTLWKGKKHLSTANFVLNVEKAPLDRDTVSSESKIRELYNVVDNAEQIIAAGERFEQITDLKSALSYSGLDISANKIYTITHPGQAFNSSGTGYMHIDISAPTASASWDSYLIPCSEGDVFTIFAVGGMTTYAYAFIDSNGDIQRKSSSNYTADSLNITAPANTAYLIVNDKGGASRVYSGELLKKEIASIETQLTNLNKKYSEQITDLKSALTSALTLEKVYFDGYTSNYSIVSAMFGRIVYAPCIGGATYIVSKMNTSRFSVFFLEEAPKDSAGILHDGYVSDNTATTIRTKAPNNAKYIGAYVWNLNTDSGISPDDAVNSTVITQISAFDSVARSVAREELKTAKRSSDNNFEYANPFNKYVNLFEQRGYSGGSYVYSNTRISITEPFTPDEPLYVKVKDGYLFAAPIWENGAIKNDSGWRTETVLTPGLYYTITIKKADDSDILPSEANNLVGNIFEQNGLWDILKDGKKVYKGEYIIGAPTLSGDKYYINYSATKRLTFPVPLYVKAGSVVKIKANGQGFFSARFREFDGTYLSDYIDGATTRYDDYVWNIDENSYIYVVFRTVSGSEITPAELTGSVELYEDYAFMNDRYGVIRSIFDGEAYDTRTKVRELLTEPCLVFPLVTDIHAESIVRSLFSNFEQMIDNIINLSRYVHCDCLLNLGDNTDGDEVAVTLRRNDYMLSRFMHIGIPYYQAVGNHDTNYSTKSGSTGNTKLTMAETYRSYISATKDVIVNENNFTDYYNDFEWCGVRLVVINSNYMNAYAFSPNTAQWLSETALNTDKIVLLATHLSPIPSQNWNNNNPTNSADVASAIQTFVTNGGTLIQLCGHSHADYSFTSPWLCVFSDCQKFERADLSGEGYQRITGYDSLGIVAPDRTAGTETEDSWSVVVLRPKARKINFVRFGAGNDREYTF